MIRGGVACLTSRWRLATAYPEKRRVRRLEGLEGVRVPIGKLLVLIIVVLFTSVKEGEAMYFKKPVLFSEVTGIVMNKGVPLPNVEVKRVYVEEYDEIVDRTYTNSEGKFSFRPIYRPRFRWFDLVPHEIVITQKLIMIHEGKEYEGFICIKDNYKHNGELGGKPISLVCDLRNEFKDNGDFTGICRLGS